MSEAPNGSKKRSEDEKDEEMQDQSPPSKKQKDSDEGSDRPSKKPNHYGSDQDSNEDKDETPWHERPPYAPEDADKSKKAKYHGSCHCKDVTFEVFDDPKDAHFCHCDDCQKLHGAPAHWSAIMSKSDILFKCEPDKLMFYRTEDNSNEYKLPVKVSCKRCHSMICDEGRKMVLLFPSLIDFEDPKDREPFTPRRHVFYKMRALDVHDGQEKYEGMQFESPLMDEDEAHAGQEGITGKGSRKNRDPNEKDSKNRKD